MNIRNSENMTPDFLDAVNAANDILSNELGNKTKGNELLKAYGRIYADCEMTVNEFYIELSKTLGYKVKEDGVTHHQNQKTLKEHSNTLKVYFSYMSQAEKIRDTGSDAEKKCIKKPVHEHTDMTVLRGQVEAAAAERKKAQVLSPAETAEAKMLQALADYKKSIKKKDAGIDQETAAKTFESVTLLFREQLAIVQADDEKREAEAEAQAAAEKAKADAETKAAKAKATKTAKAKAKPKAKAKATA